MTDREHWAKMLPIIQAFVDGKEIESKMYDGKWISVGDPCFYKHFEYRIKPEPLVREWRIVFDKYECGITTNGRENIRLTFDPDTKELLSAEIIK